MTLSRSAQWRRWTIACGLAEFAGIAVAASTIVLTRIWIGEPLGAGAKAVTLATAVAAAVVEGVLVGLLQWSVLRRRFAALGAGAWVTATVVPAAALWFLGMLTPTLTAAPEPAAASAGSGPPAALQLLAGAAGGAVAGAVFGAGQWTVLRHHAERAGRWIWANVLGWTAGMAWIFLAAAIPGPETGIGAIALLGAAGGLLGGLTVGAITGLFLVRLDARADPRAGRLPASGDGLVQRVPPSRER